MGFSVLYQLHLWFFHLRVPMVFPCWFGHSFQLPLLQFWVFSFHFFYRFQRSFPLFRLLCCSSYFPRFICCLLRFLFLGYALSFLILFPSVRHLCLSSILVAWCVFRPLIPNFLYGLFVLVSSVSLVLFFFSVLSRFYFWGLVSVRWLTAAPTVSIVTPPLFRPLRLLCLLLCSSVRLLRLLLSSLLFRIPHSWLLLLVFLYVFFHELVLRLLLPAFFLVFPHAMAQADPPVLPLRFPWVQLRLLLALCGAYRVALLVVDFRVWFLTVPVLRFPAVLLFLRVRTFTGFFPFSSLCFLGLWVLPLCPLYRILCWRFSSLRLWCLLSRCTVPL